MPLDARRTVGLQPRLGECCRETSYSLPGTRKTVSYSSLSRRPCLLRGLEPYRDDISSLMDDMRFTWATQTTPWGLAKLQSARGNKRVFDSAELVKRPGELDDRWVANRVGFDPSTLAKRRWRDKKLALPSSRAEIDWQELPDGQGRPTMGPLSPVK